MSNDLKETDKLERPKNPLKAAFLVAYLAAKGHKSNACKSTGINRKTFYRWLAEDADFKRLFDQAHEELCDDLELEARRRAVEGWQEPVFYEGVVCGHKTRFSDTMLAMLLNGNLPEKYQRQKIEHSGPDGKPIEMQLSAQADSRAAILNDPDYLEFREKKRLGSIPIASTNGHHETNGHTNGSGHHE